MQDIPKFDPHGLWFHREIGFSRAGTLKQTVAVWVEQAPDGYTHEELQPMLRVRVHSDLGRQLGTNVEQARQAVHDWQSQEDAEPRIEAGQDGLAVVRSLTQGTLDFKAAATGLDFPFDRPYLDLYDRGLTALRATDAFLRTPPRDRQVTSALKYDDYVQILCGSLDRLPAAFAELDPLERERRLNGEASENQENDLRTTSSARQCIAFNSGPPPRQNRGDGTADRCSGPEPASTAAKMMSRGGNPTGS